MISNSSDSSIRSVLIAFFLIPINCYWIVYTEMIWWGLFPTTMSLFFNVVFCLFLIILLNLAIKHIQPNWMLTQKELLVIYILLCIGTTVASHDFGQILVPLIGHTFWFETPENEWKDLFFPYIPEWLTIQEKSVLEGYYNGDSTLYKINQLKAWIIPTFWWTTFIVALFGIMACINVILRKQWIEHEKLAYPIIELPFAMAQENGMRFFNNRLFWLAFVAVSILNLINGLSYFFPGVPIVGVRFQDIGYLFTEKPWSALGTVRFSIYPFVIGLGFFMPLDLSFSCWFFFLFRKFQHVLSSALGLRSFGFPFDRQQSLGAYLGLSVIAIWTSRKYLIRIFRHALIERKSDLDESNEPIRYRTAILGIVIGLAYLIGFSHSMGLTSWIATLFFLIYLFLSVGITRMRAESGAPAHDLHIMGADYTLAAFLGTRFLGRQNLTAITFFFFFNRAHRSHAMPHQLEGFKLASRAGFRPNLLIILMILAVVVGSISSFWAYVHNCYHFGSNGGFGAEPFRRLEQQINYPTGPESLEIIFIGIGMGVTFILMFFRMKFLWWPFHAVGYAVSGADDWCMNWLWLSLLISSLIKWILLKQGGVKVNSRFGPFFLGLVLGEFISGSLWSIYGIIFNTQIFPFKDW